MLTTTNGVPYPENGDPISSYPATLQGMAQKVDAGGAMGRYQLAALTINNATWTQIPFDTEPASGGDVIWPGPADGLTYAAGVFTVTKPGLWLIQTQVAVLANATMAAGASLRAILRVSAFGSIGAAGTNERLRNTVPMIASKRHAAALTLPIRLNLGAKFDVAGYQDSGAAQAVEVGGDHPTQINAVRVAP